MEPAYVFRPCGARRFDHRGRTSTATTWLNQRAQVKAGQRAAQIEHLEALFDDFIVAASKSYGEALVSSEPKIEEIVKLYAMISQMRVLCSAQTVKMAEEAMSATLDTYFSPNTTVRELHEVIKSGVGIDPLRHFADAAGKELELLRSPSSLRSLQARSRQRRPCLRRRLGRNLDIIVKYVLYYLWISTVALNRFAVLEDSHLANTAADEIGLSGSDHDHEANEGGPVPVRDR